MERFEFEADGVPYVIYVTADSDEGGRFVTFDVSRADDGEMLNSEESKVRREFNQWYCSK
jgi:hypothetical protein